MDSKFLSSLCMCALFSLGLLLPGAGLAAESSRAYNTCWETAAARHHVDPWLLYSIASVESGYNATVISAPNSNGTVDVGLMQINSVWLPKLSEFGISRQDLKNPCVSIYVGAWILAKNFRRYGYSWKAIAAYNVGSVNTPARRRIGIGYARKVYSTYDTMVNRYTRLYKKSNVTAKYLHKLYSRYN